MKTDSLAKKIISEVTAKAIKEAPGVSLIGVSTDVNAEADLEGIERSFRRLYSLHERARGAVPGPDYRFLRLPVLDGCRTSGLPASLVMETWKSSRSPRGDTLHCPLSVSGNVRLPSGPGNECLGSFGISVVEAGFTTT